MKREWMYGVGKRGEGWGEEEGGKEGGGRGRKDS